ncbi:MAG: ATP-dependent DNA ligase [Nitrososphaerales archaeon]|jgi:DNA ligase-1
MKQSAPFSGLARTLEDVKSTRSKNEKVNILAAYLTGLQPEDAETAARVSSGRSSERGSRDEAQVGYSTLLEVVKETTGVKSEQVSKAYLRHGDLGEVTEELLGEKKEQTLFLEPLTLHDLEDVFAKLRSTKGKGSSATRRALVKSLILRATPVEGKYVVKVLTGEMRTGLVSGLVEEAISRAYSVHKEEVGRAHMVVGDLGLLAGAAARGEVWRLRITPFRPVNFMLAEPMASPSEVAAHFGKEVYAEYKYDGVRVQVHKRGDEVRLYSRRLEDITTSFAEAASSISRAEGSFILDGEIVPFTEGRPLPFQLLQRRLGRMEGFEDVAKKVPVTYFAFDILYRDGKEKVGLALTERRNELSTVMEGVGVLAHSEVVRKATEIEAAFRRSRRQGYEGLVLKDPGSPYTMGRRGSGWVKLKEELDTVDAVIVAAEYGHGKRAGVISDYTFAVRDGGALRTIGKAYSGLTDAEILEMTGRMKELTEEDHGYWRRVRPEVVVEVAFDSVQRSLRHDSGYALRFPRIKRIRRDKSVADTDTVETVARIFSRQKLKVEEA